MARRNRRPTLECLEGRIALSTTMGAAPLIRPHHVALNGGVSGSFSFNPGIRDTGTSQTLTGTGSLEPIGAVNASGTMNSTGFIAKGHATGMFTFANTSGSITIKLTGPSQAGFAGLPRNFTYKIVGSTGTDAGARGSGKATLSEVEADAIPPGTGAHVIVGPIFGLTLHSS